MYKLDIYLICFYSLLENFVRIGAISYGNEVVIRGLGLFAGLIKIKDEQYGLWGGGGGGALSNIIPISYLN